MMNFMNFINFRSEFHEFHPEFHEIHEFHMNFMKFMCNFGPYDRLYFINLNNIKMYFKIYSLIKNPNNSKYDKIFRVIL